MFVVMLYIEYLAIVASIHNGITDVGPKGGNNSGKWKIFKREG